MHLLDDTHTCTWICKRFLDLILTGAYNIYHMRPIPLSKRKALFHAKPEELIRVYTFQHKAALDVAKDRGYFTGNEDYIEDWLLEPYKWIRAEMPKHIDNFSGDYPIWAYLKRPHIKEFKKYPDDVLITAFVPRKRILFSDYSHWHIPLNNGPICFSEEEWDSFEGDVRDTWHHCLDICKSAKGDSWKTGTNYIQACIDRLYVTDIIATKHK